MLFLEVMLSFYKSSCTFEGYLKMKNKNSADFCLPFYLEKFPVPLHLGVRLS